MTASQSTKTPGDLVPVAQRLASHPWVAAATPVAQPAASGLLIAPTHAGLHAYRCIGRAGIAARWAEHLGNPLPPLWRLVESPALPAEALLCATLPEEPVEESSDGGADGEVHHGLRIPLELAIFRTHFPIAPIVPGVEQVRWAVRFGQRDPRLALPGRFAGLEMLRFRRVMQPGAAVLLALRADTRSGTLHFSFRQGRGADDPLISDGRILFRDAVST